MRDPSPTMLRRLIALRPFDLFDGVELADLALVADNVVESRFDTGATVAEPAARPPALHLIIDGAIASRARAPADGPRDRVWRPREAFAALEVLARRPLVAPAIAVEPTQTLALAAGDLDDILEDSFGLLVAVIRELARRVAGRTARPVRSRLPAAPVGPLGLVDRMLVIRGHLPFASSRLEAVATLAHAADEVAWPTGTVIARAGDLARDALIVVDGALVATSGSSDPVPLGPGAGVGVLELLGGLRHAATVTAVAPVRALRLSRTDVFDVIEDHTELGMSIATMLAAALLDLGPDAPRPHAPPPIAIATN